MRGIVLLVGLICLAGCAVSPHDGPPSTSDATLTPGWSRLRSAAVDAAASPWTWAPVVAAGALQIGHADRHVADWSSDHNPIFGSQDTAGTASDVLLGASIALSAGTALALPDSRMGTHDRAAVLGVDAGAGLASYGITEGLKSVVHRRRPDDSGRDDSFPSVHSALAGTSATLSARNIDRLDLSGAQRFALKGLAGGLAVGTDYARVSAREHYPADVLVGAALGHFIGAFADQAFLGGAANGVSPTVDVSRHGARIGFASTF